MYLCMYMKVYMHVSEVGAREEAFSSYICEYVLKCVHACMHMKVYMHVPEVGAREEALSSYVSVRVRVCVRVCKDAF
jgi:hypothetical protein